MTCERLPFIPDTPNDDLVLLHQFHVCETYGLHRHAFYEVFYVVRGQAMHEVNGSAQVTGEGALVFIRPDDRHCYRYLAQPDFEFINVNIAPELLAGAFSYLRLDRAAFDDPPFPPMVRLTGARHAEMRRKFTELADMAPGPARRQAFCALLPEVLRGLADYRMLIYAVILILVMLATNNPGVQDFINTKFRKKKKKEGTAK